MSRADYAHWNEEADLVWWQEEGRHEPSTPSLWDERDLDGPTHDGQAEPDVCIAEGNFSTRGGTEIWICDGCDDPQEFVRDADGNFSLKTTDEPA